MSRAAPRALVVEDDPAWQSILTELLEDMELQVDVCPTLESALAQSGAQRHRLAVVDLSMEGSDPRNQDGLRVLEALRQRDPGCTSILLSGYATVEAAVSAITTHGALTCLQKERFSRSAFREWVRRALAAPPLDAQPDDDVPATVNTVQQPPARKALVVEDDAGWRSILAELLEDAGYQARQCSGYGDALGWLRREKVHLALVDLSLDNTKAPAAASELPGYRLLAAARALNVPTIVVSGVAAPGEIEQAYREQGIFAFVEKQTFDRRAFLRTLQAARADAQPDSALEGLSEREREVLARLARGLTNQQIAVELVISLNTVKRHVKAIYRKLDVHTRSAAAARALSPEE